VPAQASKYLELKEAAERTADELIERDRKFRRERGVK
jgi:hypothetical protein